MREIANIRKKQHDVKFANLDPKILGKDAPTIYRDRKGRKLDMLTEMMRQQEGKYRDDSEEKMEWGKGLVQKREAEDKKAEEESEKKKNHLQDYLMILN